MQGQHYRFGPVQQADRQQGEEQLRGLEAAGADTAHLAKALMDHFHRAYPRFLGLGSGFQRRDQLHPSNPDVGLLGLAVYQDGWSVLDFLGQRWDLLLNHLLSRWPPSMWLDDAVLLRRIPQEMQEILHNDGLVFGPQASGLDLEWLPPRLACSLTVRGPISGVRLPKTLECRGLVHLEGLGGLRTLGGITAPGQCLTVIGCQDLERIELPTGTKLAVRDCYQLNAIVGKITADLHVEGCPSLETIIGWLPREAHPAPALTIRDCLRLKAIGQHTSVARTCGNLTLEHCSDLNYLQNLLVIRGHKDVNNCPALGPMKGGW